MRLRSFVRTALGLIVFGVSATAFADPFVIRTSRPEAPATEVQRRLVLEKEWLEFGFGVDFKESTQQTDADGELSDSTYKFRRTVGNVGIRYGLSPRWTIHATLPYVMTTLNNDLNANLSDRGWADVRFGADWEAWGRRSGAQLSSLALRIENKQATGNEARGSAGDPHIILGTGTTDLGFFVMAKHAVSLAAFYARAGYVHKFSGVAMYVFDVDNGQGLNGRMDPGNAVVAGGGLAVQPLAFLGMKVDADYTYRMESGVGKTGDNLLGIPDITPIPDSEVTTLDIGAKLLIEPSVNWTFAVGGTFPMLSTNSALFWPLEELSPSYGNTYSGTVYYRW